MRNTLGGPRALLRRLREIGVGRGSVRARFDMIVVQIAANMVAEVCSVYVLSGDQHLELYATEGLNRDALHLASVNVGEGLVGLVAQRGEPLSLFEVQEHPAFSYHPERGEELYHSFLGVPILRGGVTLGVLVVQNKVRREYSEEEIEVLQTTAMLLAEMIASGRLAVSTKKQLEELPPKEKPPGNKPRQSRTPRESRSGWDFFLSYAKEDERFARFVDDVFRKAGYRVFTQFRNMPVGANFVREMQIGLRGSARFVAILSPHYVTSNYCEAEWSAAYQEDPIGDRRKIVPFLIQPADIAPLARGIVYKPLVGLSREDAAQAILDAIDHHGSVMPTEPWPGTAALDYMIRATRDVYDVAPDGNNRLAPKHAKAGKAKKSHGFLPEELYADMLRAFIEIAEHVCDPTEEKRIGQQFHFSDRLKRHAKMLRDATPSNFESADALAISRAIVGCLRALALDEKDGLLPPGEMIVHYKSDLTGYYKHLESVFPGLKKYRKQHALARFTPPNEAARQGLDEILTKTPTYEDVTSKPLADDLRKAKEAIEAANDLSPTASPEEVKANLVEPHMSAAAQVTPLWNWIANPAEKFANAGKTAKDAANAIENYEKLYKGLAKGKDYVDWLLQWFF